MTGDVDLVGIGTLLAGIGAIIAVVWSAFQQVVLNRHSRQLSRRRRPTKK